jgi:hypothetical protein
MKKEGVRVEPMKCSCVEPLTAWKRRSSRPVHETVVPNEPQVGGARVQVSIVVEET